MKGRGDSDSTQPLESHAFIGQPQPNLSYEFYPYSCPGASDSPTPKWGNFLVARRRTSGF